MKKIIGGFSLIELIIVVAIVGIIGAVAYPSYIEHIKTGRRADAKGALVSLASTMSRWYAQNNSSYRGAAVNGEGDSSDTGSPAFFPSTVPIEGGTATYNLTIEAADDSTYRLRATPTGVQTGDGYLELLHNGVKRWDENNDGSIGSGESDWDTN